MIPIKQGNPVIVGEVLFDCFPDNNNVLGGAPFNVAWHLQGFGMSPLMVSAVGNDELGKQVLGAMKEWHMNTDGIEVNNNFATGKVRVSLQGGQPSYEIVENQAYDNLSEQHAVNLFNNGNYSIIYHGSLFARTEHSRKLLQRVLQGVQIPIFVDINLRSPWWSIDFIRETFARARWVKLNDDELQMLAGLDGIVCNSIHECARNVKQKYSIELLIVTQGSQGAFCLSGDKIVEGKPVNARVVDTVGAGDSFSAVFIFGLSHGWSLDITMQRALEFAARVCEMRGATSMNQALYESLLNKWQ